ncbi:hypothetical protein V8E55_005949 [Tylopilus felleus]
MYHSEGAPGQVRPPDLVNVSTQRLLSSTKSLLAPCLHSKPRMPWFTPARPSTSYNIASKHGLRATFAPRLASDSCQ